MIQKLLLLIGLTCLGLWGFFTVQARIEQSALEDELYLPQPSHSSASIAKHDLQAGDLFRRLEVPRLNLSVMIIEGIGSETLRLGAGHIPAPLMRFASPRVRFFPTVTSVEVHD